MLTVSEYDDRIDLSELRSELDEWKTSMEAEIEDANNDLDEQYEAELEEWEAEDEATRGEKPEEPDHEEVEDHYDWGEYQEAEEFCDEAECCGDHAIADSHFPDYARELAEDMYGDMDSWPMSYIDWDYAADELKNDYSSVSWGFIEFWVR